MPSEGRRPLPCEPVLLIHAESPAGGGLAACCGEPFRLPRNDEYAKIPRQPCPGCMVRLQTHGG